MKNRFTILGASLVFSFAISQQPASSSDQVMKGVKEKEKLEQTSLVKNLPFKNIGPSVMSGRVVDVDVNPEKPSEFYVGYASGGLWYTNNNGTTFQPVMDNAATINIGDIAVDWKNNILWVGPERIILPDLPMPVLVFINLLTKAKPGLIQDYRILIISEEY